MKVSEIMSPSVTTVGADESIHRAALRMAENDVGILPVTEADRVVGVLTDRDIATRAVARGTNTDLTSVSEIMTRDVQQLSHHDSVQEAADKMKQLKIRRVLVSDDAGKTVGVVSLGDLAVRANGDDKSAEVLQKVSEPG